MPLRGGVTRPGGHYQWNLRSLFDQFPQRRFQQATGSSCNCNCDVHPLSFTFFGFSEYNGCFIMTIEPLQREAQPEVAARSEKAHSLRRLFFIAAHC